MTANAIAEAIFSHADKTHATKADIARLEGKIDALATELRGLSRKAKRLINMVAGLYVAMAALIVTNLIA